MWTWEWTIRCPCQPPTYAVAHTQAMLSGVWNCWEWAALGQSAQLGAHLQSSADSQCGAMLRRYTRRTSGTLQLDWCAVSVSHLLGNIHCSSRAALLQCLHVLLRTCNPASSACAGAVTAAPSICSSVAGFTSDSFDGTDRGLLHFLQVRGVRKNFFGAVVVDSGPTLRSVSYKTR